MDDDLKAHVLEPTLEVVALHEFDRPLLGSDAFLSHRTLRPIENSSERGAFSTGFFTSCPQASGSRGLLPHTSPPWQSSQELDDGVVEEVVAVPRHHVAGAADLDEASVGHE